MAAITSTATGNWSAGGTWVGGIAPVAGDTVTIAAGHTVTFNQNDTVSNSCLTLSISGTLAFSTTMTTSLWVGNNVAATNLIVVASTGAIQMGTSGTPIPATYTATIVIDGTTDAGSAFVIQTSGANKGRIDTYGDYSYNAASQSITVGSASYTTGLYDTTLASDAASGASTFVLTADLGLRAGGGDTIALATSSETVNPANSYETVTTTAYNSGTKTVTISGTLASTHESGGYVMNLTRNVVIKAANSARRPALTMSSTTSGTTTPLSLYHTQFLNISGITGTNSSVSVIANPIIVGCAFQSPLATTSFTMVSAGIFACTVINTFLYGGGLGVQPSVGSYTAVNPTYTRCGVMGVNTGSTAGSNVTYTDCWWVATNGGTTIGTIGGSTFNNCTFAYGRFAVVTSVIGVVFNNCTFKYLSQALDSAVACELNSCTFNSITNVTYNNCKDVVIRGGTYTNESWAYTDNTIQAFPNTNTQSQTRPLREDGTPLGTRSLYVNGILGRYTSGTSPDSVFPVPSGSTYANRIFNLQSNLSVIPIKIRYAVPVEAGELFTFTVPVWPLGWGSTFPSATEMYLQLQIPGSTSRPVSTNVVTANSSWQTLTVSGTAVDAGFMVCDFTLSKYVSGATMYVDFPKGMTTASMVWYDGAPAEGLARLDQSSAADVWNYLQADATTSGTMGKKVLDDLTTSKFIGLK